MQDDLHSSKGVLVTPHRHTDHLPERYIKRLIGVEEAVVAQVRTGIECGNFIEVAPHQSSQLS